MQRQHVIGRSLRMKRAVHALRRHASNTVYTHCKNWIATVLHLCNYCSWTALAWWHNSTPDAGDYTEMIKSKTNLIAPLHSQCLVNVYLLLCWRLLACSLSAELFLVGLNTCFTTLVISIAAAVLHFSGSSRLDIPPPTSAKFVRLFVRQPYSLTLRAVNTV